MRWAPGFCTMIAVVGMAACGSSGAGGNVKQEVAETEIKLDLPPPPDFKEPVPYPDGSHSITEMRLKGAKYLDQQVKVTGFVLLQYDLKVCAAQVGEKLVQKDPKRCEGKKDLADCTQKVGEKDVANLPDQCERPNFYIADTANASLEKAVWVVNVTRALREDEKKDPQTVEAFKKGPPVPVMKVGDRVIVEGTWAIKSPSGEGSSEGLLVYSALTPAPAP